MAGPYSWVASGGVIALCVLSSLLLFLCILLVSSLGIRVESRVRVNSVKLF